MSSRTIKSSESDKNPVVVIKRKIVKQKTGGQLLQQAQKLEDVSHVSEKQRSPVDFVKTSYVSGLKTQLLVPSVSAPAHRLYEIFGEPTRLLHDAVEWVVRIPTKEVLRIVLTNRRTEVWGFVLTKTVESWVKRLGSV